MIRSLYQLLISIFSSGRDFYFNMVRILGFLPGKLFLYEIAFIHKSASSTLKNGQVINNERLEYLGDAILDAVIADYLYTRFPEKDEGFLTQLRAKLVKRKMLNKLAENLGIAPLLVSRTNAEQSQINLLGNAFEALIGAIYLDKGYVRTKSYVIKKVLEKFVDLEKLSKKESDFKSRIIEWAQKINRKSASSAKKIPLKDLRKSIILQSFYWKRRKWAPAAAIRKKKQNRKQRNRH